MKKNIFTISLCVIMHVLMICVSFSQPENRLTPEQWKQDIDYYFDNFEKVHLNPYHKTSKEEFEKFKADLLERIPSMTDNQVFTEIMRLTALIGDGHSALNIFGFHGGNNRSMINFHIFPLQLCLFSDGLYVIKAAPEYNMLTGKRITKLNDKNIKDVLDKITPCVIGDNEYSVKFNITHYLFIAEILNGLGINNNVNSIYVTAEDNEKKEISLKISSIEMSSMQHQNNSNDKELPLYMRNDDKNYWFEYLNESKTLYINYKRVLIDPADSLTKFCKRIEEFVNSNEIERTVIDIRNNGGGNNATCQPFVNLISRNQKINRNGKLFVLIGRETFSAASYLTTKLEFNTKAIFIGEPTGASPNHYGDNRPLILPNSGLEVRLSSIYWQNSFPFDSRTATEPRLRVDLNSKDYFSNKDPFLEAALNYSYSLLNNNNYDEKITGRYLYSPVQLLVISDDNGILKMTIDQWDFIGRNVRFITTQLYSESKSSYKTDIDGLDISFSDDKLQLIYRGEKIDIKKAPADYKTIHQLIDENNSLKVVELLKEAKKNNPAYQGTTENVINGLGYYALGKNNYETAIDIFKLNVELYPLSFNTYDSLGEAYMAAGQNELAIENYKKSIELNPGNNSGKKMLEKLNNMR